MTTPDTFFNVAITSLFAREFLEGAVIIVNYRTAIANTEHWDSTTKQQAMREVTKSAAFATLLAVIIVGAVAAVLSIFSRHLNDNVIEIILGVSFLVAAICILQLSLKIPVWLGIYEKVSIIPCKRQSPEDQNDSEVVGVTVSEIRFNVTWNILREVAECLLFLIPFFLGGTAKAVPLSALAGILIAMILGCLMHVALKHMQSKFWLALFMSLFTGIFSAALFTASAHDFEKVAGETPVAWEIQTPLLSSELFPMAVFEPFGYSSTPSALMVACFSCWSLLAIVLHLLKYRASKKYRERRQESQDNMPNNAQKEQNTDSVGDSSNNTGSGYEDDFPEP